MIKLKPHYNKALFCLVFIVYALFAARPIGKETVLSLKWLRPLEAGQPLVSTETNYFPFNFGEWFGYVSADGQFAISQQKKGYIASSPAFWAEFSGEPELIDVKNPLNQTVFTLKNPHGYPFFLDNKIFVMRNGQNSVSRVDGDGRTLWYYDFSSTITCVAASVNLLLVGLLDNTIELIDSLSGARVFSFELSASRLAAVYGCALSEDGKKIAVISGKDKQRFVLMEPVNGVWRVTYHEFLGEGFNRPVSVQFVNNGKYVVFERENGAGIYNTETRKSSVVNFEGRIIHINADGTNDLFFFMVEQEPERKKIVVVENGRIMISAPFESRWGFFERHKNEVFIGGGKTLAAFSIEKK
jgi:hypothetical protein